MEKVDQTPTDKSQIVVTGPATKSRRSNQLQNLNCMEFAPNSAGGLTITDSKNPGGPALHFTRAEIACAFASIKEDEFGVFPDPTA